MNWITRPGLAFLKGDVNANITLTTCGWTWHIYSKNYIRVLAESPTQEIDGDYVYIGESTLLEAQQKVEAFIQHLHLFTT